MFLQRHWVYRDKSHQILQSQRSNGWTLGRGFALGLHSFPGKLECSFGQCCRRLVTERKNSGVLLVDFCARHRLT